MSGMKSEFDSLLEELKHDLDEEIDQRSKLAEKLK